MNKIIIDTKNRTLVGITTKKELKEHFQNLKNLIRGGINV